MGGITVMVIDDSAVVRQVMVRLLEADQEIHVIGAAADPLFALQRMKTQWPDVILLDIEMPRMDGLTFLRRVMQERPTPVVICSTLTDSGAAMTVEALAAGALTTLAKPRIGLQQHLIDAAHEITAAVKMAARANVSRLRSQPPAPVHFQVPTRNSADIILTPGPDRAMTRTTEHVVAIGTSTGGTQALERVLTKLPSVSPGVVIVQHMPAQFTGAFAARLDGLCEITVKEAENNDRVLPGRALIAPGGKHMLLKRSGARYYVEIRDGPPVNRHCPSVDVLFRSVAQCAGPNALGIIMTGMGDDGARGLKEMRDAGAKTIAQDEASCVVFGMPKEALRLQAVERCVALEYLPAAIVSAS